MRGSSPLTRGKPGNRSDQSEVTRLIPAHAGKTTANQYSYNGWEAHPRSRGENGASPSSATGCEGSSPLTRGKPGIGRRCPRLSGLIPAHAGKTPSKPPKKWPPAAHPRSRGENGHLAHPAPHTRGSSPLTRGKRWHSRFRVQPDRLIPAHAGKTCCSTMWGRNFPAHPRSRGENGDALIAAVNPTGSSPLTRGKHPYMGWRHAHRRLIPAHAGKTERGVQVSPWDQAHPRSRGENRPRTAVLPARCGSSPLTRGKRLQLQAPRSRKGLIPAHAGKTLCWCECSSGLAAHPRSRGENATFFDEDHNPEGSSPLTRGKLSSWWTSTWDQGLIPAHAGKTLRLRVESNRHAAHPRSRGENRLSIATGERRAGSSPLTRGKQHGGDRPLATAGLIPAHAGKTATLTLGVFLAAAHPRSRGENG